MAAKDQFAYFYPPDQALESKRFIKNNVSFEDLKNPIIMKYSELIEDYLHLNKPLHFKAISQLLASHAKTKQLIEWEQFSFNQGDLNIDYWSDAVAIQLLYLAQFGHYLKKIMPKF